MTQPALVYVSHHGSNGNTLLCKTTQPGLATDWLVLPRQLGTSPNELVYLESTTAMPRIRLIQQRDRRTLRMTEMLAQNRPPFHCRISVVALEIEEFITYLSSPVLRGAFRL